MSDLPQSNRELGGFPLLRWAAYPAVGFTLVFFVAPLVVMACVSFWLRTGGKLEAAWTLANYYKFFTRTYLFDALVNSVEVTLTTTAISILIAYPLAYILAYRVPPRWQKIVLIVTVLPFWTAYVVRSYSWLLVLSDNGIINATLMSVGLIDEPFILAYTRGATILGFVHFFTMLLTLTIYANLVQINPSYRRAAADLGASDLQVFFRITLPLSIPGMAVGAFITFVIAIGDYITPQILGGNTEVLVPQAIMLQIARAANFPMASVMSLTLMAVVVVVYLLSARHLRMDRL
jgi:spermidine/putrescine transport system permease protein